MYGNPGMAKDLAQAVVDVLLELPRTMHVVLCPPAPLAAPLAGWIAQDVVDDKTLPLSVGGQDCHDQPEGAYTGDISAFMLKAVGCDYVIVGHSERRLHHGETDEMVRRKAARAIASGLIPIICIGETEAERASGQAHAVLARQIAGSVPEGVGEGNFILAYEPVWAIGSGRLPAAGDIRDTHATILEVAAKRTMLAPSQISVLYGGSVKPDNAHEILETEGVAGVLVGGASLKANDFCRIIEAAV